MKQVIVRYRVKPERVAEHEDLVRAVLAQFAAEQPDGVGYAAFKLDDGVTFAHVAALDDGFELRQVEAFRRFRENLEERCDEPPVVTELTEVGSYRAFGTAA